MAPVRVKMRRVASILGDPPVGGALAEDKGPQPPPIGGRGAPEPTPKGEQPDQKQTVRSTPSAGGAEKNKNATKRKLQ